MNRGAIFLLVFSTVFSGCYSFRGIAIESDVQTYYVSLFSDQTAGVVPDLSANITEKLNIKIRNESPLVYSDTDPDVEFVGTITRFEVTAEAPQSNSDIAFNRLTIAVRVEYINHKYEESSKTLNESWWSEFPSDQNLLDVQDEQIDVITDQLVENIFIKAFTNW